MPSLPPPRISLEHSPGLERRGRALAAYLGDLHAGLESGLRAAGLERALEPVGLWVLSEAEWGRRARYPYGFTFYRKLKTGAGTIFAPGDYPGRLLWVLREVVLRAERAGCKAPGAVTEFLDLTLGHELGHALADQLGLRTGVRWLDEFLATYLYLAALRATNPDAYGRVLDWGRVFAGAGGTDCALADPSLTEPGLAESGLALRFEGESGVERRDLGAFEYPLVRLPLANQAWYQARFTLQAADLLERRGLEFVASLLEHLPAVRERGGVHRSVVALEPSFRTWFRSFGEAV